MAKTHPAIPTPSPIPIPKTWWQEWRTTVVNSGLSAFFVIGGAVYVHYSDYLQLAMDNRIDLKLKPGIDKLDALGQRIATIEGQLSILIIQKAAMQPTAAMNARQTAAVLKTAKSSGTKLDPLVISDAGKQFISAGKSSPDPAIWNTALAFLDYKSYLNIPYIPPTDKFVAVEKQERHEWSAIFPINAKSSNFLFMHGGPVPAEKAAVFEPIGKPLNVGKKIGSEFILLSGSTGIPGGWKLDGYRLRKVIFKETEITYEGGPIDMQDVYFVNCTFHILKKPNGEKFATTVLVSAPATTFQAKS